MMISLHISSNQSSGQGDGPLAQARKHRNALIWAAAKLLRRQGYAATGLAEILSESGAPRGSLYYYFPGGKEEIAAAAVEAAGGLVDKTLEQLSAETADFSTFLDRYAEMLAGWMAASKFRDGCPIATTLLETVPMSDLIGSAGQTVFGRWRSIIAEVLRRDGWPAADAQPFADHVMATLEGALLMARLQQDTAPIENAAAQLRRLAVRPSA